MTCSYWRPSIIKVILANRVDTLVDIVAKLLFTQDTIDQFLTTLTTTVSVVRQLCGFASHSSMNGIELRKFSVIT